MAAWNDVEAECHAALANRVTCGKCYAACCETLVP